MAWWKNIELFFISSDDGHNFSKCFTKYFYFKERCDLFTANLKDNLMEEKKQYTQFYLRTPSNLATHLSHTSKRWGMSKNGYLNKLLRDDMELEAIKNTRFVEDAYLKLLDAQGRRWNGLEPKGVFRTLLSGGSLVTS